MVGAEQSKAERKAVVFGGYPDFVHLRDRYEAEEPDEDGDEANGNCKDSRRQQRLEGARQTRSTLQQDLAQLRFQYTALLHLVRDHFRPDDVAQMPGTAPTLLVENHVAFCTCDELQQLLQDSGGWRGLQMPIVFEAPEFHQPFTSREALLAHGFRRDFPVATVLGDALAAQFGPDWLAEGQTFEQCQQEHCFSQVQGQSTQTGPLRELWESLPDWMRCPMVVMSTGPGGSGVAFHKHSSAWLVTIEGTKHWWLYPPGGPPTRDAYHALALCPAHKIAEAVAALPPEARPIEITQRPGYGVFVPALWWHATFNVGPTLSVGSQYHVFDLNFEKAVAEHSDSGFVLYHHGCEIHKTSPSVAAEYFERAIHREPLNLYYGMNQLRFYLNLVLPPKQTLNVIERLFATIRSQLDSKQQMLVLRFIIPSLFDFIEWNKDYDRLLKYSVAGCRAGFDAVFALTRSYLPGGDQCRPSSTLPSIEHLRYMSSCSQCGAESFGRPGEPNSIWAHKFYCLDCFGARQRAQCAACSTVSRHGQMGHAGTARAKNWYCAKCWSTWNVSGKSNLHRVVRSSIARAPPAVCESSDELRSGNAATCATPVDCWEKLD